MLLYAFPPNGIPDEAGHRVFPLSPFLNVCVDLSIGLAWLVYNKRPAVLHEKFVLVKRRRIGGLLRGANISTSSSTRPARSNAVIPKQIGLELRSAAFTFSHSIQTSTDGPRC